ncbi:MAG: hypothetical protein JNM18_15565 [Planctomycetaceae bacterium]|nr:hypothetical protein [Planctomycetaceae bacterium]
MIRFHASSRTVFALVLGLAWQSASLALSAEWRMTREVPAPEAVQAAAADDKFLYAINNTQVAKYDRVTGQRVAVSHGAAKHLNSGYFWQGRLFCAHSNYPAQPEQSEIKVLDVESMQLTTYKDFGDYGGSLTWCVRRDGTWWCSFAKYGDRNGETFLVRFDDQWHELSRYTLPRELVARLGRYSLSGGVWRGEHLLVTGHDDPVLFQVRVPTMGNVLELVGHDSAPFTGQGIAAEPVGGGLIGIHRAKRLIVLAEQ